MAFFSKLFASPSQQSAGKWVEQGEAEERSANFTAAIQAYSKAIAIDPALGKAHFKLGLLFLGEKKFDPAIEAFSNALCCKPDSKGAYLNRGNAFFGQKNYPLAIADYEAALSISPDFVEAYVCLGNVAEITFRYADAVEYYEQALKFAPDNAEICRFLGNALIAQGNFDKALKQFERAIQLTPDHAETYGNAGYALHRLGKLNEAHHFLAKALTLSPENPLALNNMGNLLTDLGRLHEACNQFRKCIELVPDFWLAHSNLLFSLNYCGDATPDVLFAAAQAYGKSLEQRVTPFSHWHSCTNQSRRLRIGFVSGDLHEHPVGYFFEGMLRALLAKRADQVDIHLYVTRSYDDTVSRRIRALDCHWIDAAHLTDDELAKHIHENEIDILIDLAGHTGENRLGVFAMRPAPVQCTWLGYFATTGLTTIDYLIADPLTAPPALDQQFTETVWRLPETRLCFTIPDHDAEVSPLPALANGHITFGCFNHLTKLNDRVLDVWAKIMATVPKSTLLLKANQLDHQTLAEELLARFDKRGIARQRITLEGRTSRHRYLERYQSIDIALDPFPYPGGTTTVEALWMGVPVVTLSGNSFVARQGHGLLANAGLADWIAKNEEEYFAICVWHATHLGQLAKLRSQLRTQVTQSPIFDTARFAEHFHAALREMLKHHASQGMESTQDAR